MRLLVVLLLLLFLVACAPQVVEEPIVEIIEEPIEEESIEEEQAAEDILEEPVVEEIVEQAVEEEQEVLEAIPFIIQHHRRYGRHRRAERNRPWILIAEMLVRVRLDRYAVRGDLIRPGSFRCRSRNGVIRQTKRNNRAQRSRAFQVSG